MLGQIARAKACLLKGNGVRLQKAANLFLDDYRNGRLGPHDPGIPPQEEKADEATGRRKLEKELIRLEAMREYEGYL